MVWDLESGHYYRHVEKYIQEGTLWYTESKYNSFFFSTENQAEREVSKRPSYHT